MKNNTFNSIVQFTVLLFFFSFSVKSFSQTNLIKDTDGDGIADDSDLCPKEKGSLKFYGCTEISDEYIWDDYEYEEYPAHIKIEVIPANFESITEKVLQKPFHREGATFEEVQVPYPIQSSYPNIKVTEIKFEAIEKEVLIDEITNMKTKIKEYQIVTSSIQVGITDEENTYTIYKLIKDGNGSPVEAKYIEIPIRHLKFISPASVKEVAVHAVKKIIKVRKNIFGEKNNENTKDVFVIVEEMPEFPGGEEKMFEFIYSNLQHPEEARKNKIEGLVVLSFIIEKDGSITNVKVLTDIGGGCGEEALRIVEMMPKWVPGKQKGKPTSVGYNLPVNFKLQ